MDRRERMSSLLVAIRAALQSHEAGVWTAMPAVVAGRGFVPGKVTVDAQVAIQAQVRAPTAQTWTNVNLPICQDCPVVFPGGGGFVLTFPIAVGDEGLLVFAARCIDAWWQNGGSSNPQAELRMHDLSDGFFLPGCFSNPRVPSGISTTDMELRTVDNSCKIQMTTGGVVNITAPGGVNINGAIISAAGEVTDALGKVLGTHVHGGVSTGSSDTGPPV